MSVSDDRKASYFFASFLTSFLFLFSLCRGQINICSGARAHDHCSLFEIVDRHVLKVDLFRTIDVRGISENANRHARTGDTRKPSTRDRSKSANTAHANTPTTIKNALDSARETLVALGVIVLEANLQLYRLDKVATFLAGRLRKEFLDGAPHACH